MLSLKSSFRRKAVFSCCSALLIWSGVDQVLRANIEGAALLHPQKVFEERGQRLAAVLAHCGNFNLLVRGLPRMRGIVLHRIAVAIEGMAVVGEQLRMIERRGLQHRALVG